MMQTLPVGTMLGAMLWIAALEQDDSAEKLARFHQWLRSPKNARAFARALFYRDTRYR